MSDEWQTYIKDPRTICKYGTKCYQKNPEHHSSFKHPPQIFKKDKGKKHVARFKPYSRDSESPKLVKEEASEQEQEVSKVDESKKDVASKNLNMEKDYKLQLPEHLSYYDVTDCESLKSLFLVELPEDFFKFFECLNEGEPIVKTLATVNLELIGPYDLLLGKLPKLDNKELYLIHWRFFYDPPEFQAVLKKKDKSQYHIGYFRDDPNEKPVFLASNDSAKSCHITPMAENIFGAVYTYLINEKKTSPFTAMSCQKVMDKLKKYSEVNSYSLAAFDIKKRKQKIVTNTLHQAGIVVPYNKKTQLGYRPLVENDNNLKKLFAKLEAANSESDKDKVLSEIQPVITYASIAVDECDFGTGLEVGIDLFCSGVKELEPSALSSLCAVYPLLNREIYCKIIETHLKYRRKGPNMSMLSLFDK